MFVRAKGGNGIGLSITREFVNLHGGQISVQSKLGAGTTFTFTLPVIPNQTLETITGNDEPVNTIPVQPEAQNSSIKNTVSQPLVLIVEDNEDFRFYLKDNLKAYYKIVEASNGKDGWQKALACHPQLIVSDIEMPYMNGIELSQKISTDKRTCHIPVILLTAITGHQEQINGLKAGASDYLTKPFNFELLNAKISNLLSLNQNQKNTYSKQVQLVSEPYDVIPEGVKFIAIIRQYIDDNMNNPELNVEDLSKFAGVSRGTLYRRVLEFTGQKPVEYIRTIKLERAALLLEKSQLNISQIAYKTGFVTPNYFAKMFKAKYGVLPSGYINNKRKTST